MTLNKVKSGTVFTIQTLPQDSMKIQLIRMGLSEGDTVMCSTRLPGGTIVILKNRQEIAIGNSLAKNIEVILQ